MATVIFVHGTGAREQNSGAQFAHIQQELQTRRPGTNVLVCPWGDLAGYRLHANGISIPDYVASVSDVLGGPGDEQVLTTAEYEAALWGLLYRDPLGELRLMALPPDDEFPEAFPTRSTTSVDLEARVTELVAAGPGTLLSERLAAAGLEPFFTSGLTTMLAAPVYEQALWAIDDDEVAEGRGALARAILASAMELSRMQPELPAIFFDALLRDALVDLLNSELGAGEADTLGWLDPLKRRGVTLAAQLLTDQLRQRRGPVMDKVLSFIGDILLYQGRGAAVRGLIREQIMGAQPPVILLAHSLGGIACVDLLIQEDLSDKVTLLVTAGSQAPVFFEIGALNSLPYSAAASLPGSMPPWLNLYDHQDFLSFVGAGLFLQGIKDVPVDNRQPFPYAHSAYWNNPQVWDLVTDAMDNPAAILTRG